MLSCLLALALLLGLVQSGAGTIRVLADNTSIESSTNGNASSGDASSGNATEETTEAPTPEETTAATEETTAATEEAVEEIPATDLVLEDDAAFVDESGNVVALEDIALEKVSVAEPEAAVKEAVQEVIKDVKPEKAKVFYFDITPYISASGAKASLNGGSVTIKLDYPEGITNSHNIIVLHIADKLDTVKKYDNYFTFATDSFSPFTIIAIEDEAVVINDDDDDDDDDSSEVQTTAAVVTTDVPTVVSAPENAAETPSDAATADGTPKTADASPIGMLLVIFALSGLTALTCFITRRKENI
jgi:hypothetical protein